jgi:acyl-coenzyme A synthetase/AMP-(fatty) acid ligase
MNISDVVLHRVRQQPDAIAFQEGDRVLSYRQLDRFVRLVAAGLAERGVGESSLVAIDIAGTPLHLILALAVARLRAASVAMPDLPSPAERMARLRALGVRHLVGTQAAAQIDGIEFIRADATLTRGRSAGAAPGYGPSADALPWRIIWSSGSTGAPKPLACTHERSVAQMFVQQTALPYGPDTTLYLALGMQAMFALVHGLRALAFGARVVSQAPRPADTFDLCERYGVTHFVSSPSIAGMLASLTDSDSPRLPDMLMYLGGGAVSPALRARLARRITPRIGCVYGTTETGMAAFSDPATFEAHPGSAGRVVPWMQVEAVDDQDRPLPAGAAGRIRIRGVGMAREYLGDEAASAAAFRDGWFYPGDVGRVTRDGLLMLAGRTSEVLDTGGAKTTPRAIEEVLEQHPDVAEVAAFVAPGEDGQRWLAAAVVPRGAFDAKALRSYCRERLGVNAPRLIVQVAAIPRTGMGKIMRGALSARFLVKARPGGSGPAAVPGPGQAPGATHPDRD